MVSGNKTAGYLLIKDLFISLLQQIIPQLIRWLAMIGLFQLPIVHSLYQLCSCLWCLSIFSLNELLFYTVLISGHQGFELVNGMKKQKLLPFCKGQKQNQKRNIFYVLEWNCLFKLMAKVIPSIVPAAPMSQLSWNVINWFKNNIFLLQPVQGHQF